MRDLNDKRNQVGVIPAKAGIQEIALEPLFPDSLRTYGIVLTTKYRRTGSENPENFHFLGFPPDGRFSQAFKGIPPRLQMLHGGLADENIRLKLLVYLPLLG